MSLSVSDLENTEDNKNINQMLNISPILLENSAPAKHEEENLDQPKLRLTEVINITTSCNSLPNFFPSLFF